MASRSQTCAMSCISAAASSRRGASAARCISSRPTSSGSGRRRRAGRAVLGSTVARQARPDGETSSSRCSTRSPTRRRAVPDTRGTRRRCGRRAVALRLGRASGPLAFQGGSASASRGRERHVRPRGSVDRRPGRGRSADARREVLGVTCARTGRQTRRLPALVGLRRRRGAVAVRRAGRGARTGPRRGHAHLAPQRRPRGLRS